ncbi:hypothetical protein H9P43_002153 [Blastocladiella emersonii ATCC 22665]|nr:hypothetical protein H9P43_002153 [Blastocladiella emersonii ATCC 22665]
MQSQNHHHGSYPPLPRPDPPALAAQGRSASASASATAGARRPDGAAAIELHSLPAAPGVAYYPGPGGSASASAASSPPQMSLLNIPSLPRSGSVDTIGSDASTTINGPPAPQQQQWLFGSPAPSYTSVDAAALPHLNLAAPAQQPQHGYPHQLRGPAAWRPMTVSSVSSSSVTASASLGRIAEEKNSGSANASPAMYHADLMTAASSSTSAPAVPPAAAGEYAESPEGGKRVSRAVSRRSVAHSIPDAPEVELRRRKTRASTRTRRTVRMRPANEDEIIEAEIAGDDEFDWELSGGKDENGGATGDGGDMEDELAGNGRKKRRVCGWVREFYATLPFGLQCLVSAIVGNAVIFAILGIPDIMFSDANYLSKPRWIKDWTSNINLGGMPLLLWAGYLMISYTLHWATLFVLSLIPVLLQRSLVLALGAYYEDKLAEYIGLLRALHRNLTIAAWAALSNVLWNLLVARDIAIQWKWQTEFQQKFNITNDDPNVSMWWDYVSISLLAILVSSVIWTVKRLLVALIVTRFQRTAFSARIKRMRFANEVLRRLQAAVKRQSVSAGGGGAGGDDPASRNLRRQRTLKEKGLARLRQIFSRKAQEIATELGNVLLDPSALQNATAIPLTSTEAHLMAKTLYYSLVQPGRTELFLDDFLPYFESRGDARRAFRLFDRDVNGDVSKTEVKAILTELMREKQNLEDSMQDTARAVSSLERLFSGIALIVMLFAVLAVFRVKVDFTSMVTVAVPFSFIVASSASDLFGALVFLFLYSSYTVGDRISVDKEMFVVKGIALFTTLLQRGDGKIVHYPNSVLSKKPIDNIRQSGGMSEDVEIRMAVDTPPAAIAQLEQRMRAFLEANTRDYIAEGFRVAVKEINLDAGLLFANVSIDHKSNWQDMGKRADRKSRFMWALRDAIRDAGIKCPDGPAALVPVKMPATVAAAWMGPAAPMPATL